MATQLLMAKSPEEAVSFKTAAAAFLAGGTEVNRLGSEIASEADTLISLKKCSGLDSIEKTGSGVRIGSMCTFQDIVESDKVPPYLREAALFMASRTKRNMATIGGNIAALRSDSYLLPVLFAVCAEVELLGADGKACSMCINSYKEAVEAGDASLITAVVVPENVKVISKRYSNTAQSHAVLTMSAALLEDGITFAAAVKNSGVYRFKGFEEAVRKDPDMSEEAAIAFFKDADIQMADDMFGSVAYKRYLIGVTAADMYRRLKAQ